LYQGRSSSKRQGKTASNADGAGLGPGDRPITPIQPGYPTPSAPIIRSSSPKRPQKRHKKRRIVMDDRRFNCAECVL